MLNSVKNNNSKYEHNNYEYLCTKQHSNHSYKAETQVDARVNREKKNRKLYTTLRPRTI